MDATLGGHQSARPSIVRAFIARLPPYPPRPAVILSSADELFRCELELPDARERAAASERSEASHRARSGHAPASAV